MKVKIALWIVMLACVGVFAQGCSFSKDLDASQDITTEETSEYMPDSHSPSYSEPSKTDIDVSDMYYGYHKLDEDKQTIYLEMLGALEEMKDDVRLSTTDKSKLDVVFNCLMDDHPELFYVNGYKYTEYTLGSSTTGITFSGTYSMSKEQVNSTKPVLDAKINECLMNAPNSDDEYLTAKYLYEWVIDNTEYDKSVDNNQNICSVFLEGKSVCQGYAKSLQYMLQKSGIECFIVTGFTGGERHAWDVAKINGEYYYLDPTWGDASYSYSGDVDSIYDFAPSINYDYFLVTTQELTRTHSIERVVELPECDEITDNYFVREGLYLTGFDEEKLAGIFDSYASRQAGYVTIKCADDVFDDVLSQLINEQKIFDFIDVQGASIAYTSNSELKTISFWNIYQ
jgi:transglutaminase-like putative cysteine protease